MSRSQSPSKSLPEQPSEEHLRKEAKRVARQRGIQLTTAQHRLAREYGFEKWADLVSQIKGIARGVSAQGGVGASPSGPSDANPTGDNTAGLLPFLPLRGLVAFPHVVYPIYIGRPMSVRAIAYAEDRKSPLLLVAQKDALVKEPAASDMSEVGTIGVIQEMVRLPDNTIKTMVEGQKRVRVKRFVFDQNFFKAEVEEIDEPSPSAIGLRKLIDSVLAALEPIKLIFPEKSIPVTADEDPSSIADRIANYLPISIKDKQTLLETVSAAERLETILAYLMKPR